jgi:inosine-uridine nucleoside N-ribohydrolase
MGWATLTCRLLSQRPNRCQRLKRWLEVTKEGDGEAIIIAVGGLTNIAQALELDSNFAGRVKQLIIMGGAFGYNRHSGNVSPVAGSKYRQRPASGRYCISQRHGD